MKLRLSEAIRLGSMLKPQAFGTYHDARGGTCALGAAGEAAGGWEVVTEAWKPFIAIPSLSCPACGITKDTVPDQTQAGGAMVVHLNDDHKWSRERIADWIEQFESQVSRVLSPGEEEQKEEYARVVVQW